MPFLSLAADTEPDLMDVYTRERGCGGACPSHSAAFIGRSQETVQCLSGVSSQYNALQRVQVADAIACCLCLEAIPR
jgi:hypothetical protein